MESPSAPPSPPPADEVLKVLEFTLQHLAEAHHFLFISLLGSSPGHRQACYDRTIHALPRTDVKDLLEPGQNAFFFLLNLY